MKTMGPRKIGSLSNIHQRYSSRRDKQGDRLHSLAHDIINQLTVLNLSCSQIRAAAASQRPPHAIDVDHIENALSEMARLVAALARQKHTNLPAKHTSENVYVLFESDPVTTTGLT